MLDPSHPFAPKYWVHEETGVLKPAILAYLEGGEMTPEQIRLVVLYIRQWIGSPVWDDNPTATPHSREALADLRYTARLISTREGLVHWFHHALDEGINPL